MINVISHEIQKFSNLSSTWWNPTGPLKTLHAINPLRLQFIQTHITLLNSSVIDIGCGGGILSESLALAGANVTGIDMSAPAIEAAQQHWQITKATQANSGSLNYSVNTAEIMAAQYANTFDVVTCMELLEHVPDPASVVQACAKLAKPGGYIFFSTINRNPKAYLFAILGAEYLLNLLPKGTHDYAKFIKPSELANWCRAAGLTPNDLQGLHYNPLTKHYFLNQDISVNYLLHCQKMD